MSKSKQLRICLLGPAEVFLNKKLLRLQRRLLRALLFYLAYANHLVSRSRLIEVFWPGDSEEDGRRHLREILSKLRKELPDASVIITEQDRVGIDFSRVYVDAVEFLALLDGVKTVFSRHENSILPNSVFKQLVEAINLWRSPYFMAGMNTPESPEFGHWLMSVGLELENSRMHVLRLLVDHLVMNGDLVTGLYWLKMAMEYDEMDANLQHRYIVLLHQLGRISEATHYYNHLLALYKEENLGEIPNSIQQVHAQIQLANAQPLKTRNISWSGSLDLHTPFVGRKEIIQQLSLAFHRGGTVAVYGEAGSGKTRTIYELLQGLEPVPRLFYTQAHSQENELPFQPLIDLLRGTVTTKEWDDLEVVWKKSLEKLLPEIAGAGSSALPDAELDGAKSRANIFEALHQLLQLASRDQKVVFILDDAQWCDESTFAAISYLQHRNFFDRNGLLIMASRVEVDYSGLKAMLARAPRSTTVTSIYLEQLDMQDIKQLANASLGFSPSEDLIRQLAVDTGGNPLFLVETMRELLDSNIGSEQLKVATHLPIAKSMKNLLDERIRQLDPNTRNVLSTAAVMGSTLSLPLLETASEEKDEVFVKAIEVLERVHLIRPVANEKVSDYIFVHDKFREVLFTAISPARRRLLHLRTARAIEQRMSGAPQMSAVIAQHYQHAAEFELAYRYWLLAGKYASSLFSLDEATRAFEAAEKILLSSGISFTVRDQINFYSNWGEAFTNSGRYGILKKIYSRLLEISTAAKDSSTVGKSLYWLAWIQVRKINPLDAEKINTELLDHLNKSGDACEKAKAYDMRGTILMLLSKFAEASEAYQQSLQICLDYHDPDLQNTQANVLTHLAILEIYLANPVLVKEYANSAIQFAKKRPSDYLHAFNHVWLSNACWLMDDYLAGLDHANRSLEISMIIHNQHILGYALVAVAKNELRLGRVDECWNHIHQAIEISRPESQHEVISEAYSVYGQIFMNLGNYPRACEVFEEGIAQHKNNFQMHHNRLLLGFSDALFGNLDSAIKAINSIIAYGEQSGMNYLTYPGYICRAVTHYYRNDSQAARADIAAATAFCAPRKMWLQTNIAQLFEALMSLREGAVFTAVPLLQKVANESAEHHNPWHEINARKVLIQIKQTVGESTRADQDRIFQLLEFLNQNVTNRDLRPSFERFEKITLS